MAGGSIQQLWHNVYQQNPNLGGYIFVGGALVAASWASFSLGLMAGRLKERSQPTSNSLFQRETEPEDDSLVYIAETGEGGVSEEEDAGIEYPLTKINSLKEGENAAISGKVSSPRETTYGFAGVVWGDSGDVPFYFASSQMPHYGEEGLAALILAESERLDSPITLHGSLNEKRIFLVDSLKGRAGSTDYKI